MIQHVYLMLEKFDIAIIGGGILGTTISYWLASLYDLKICVIEKERDVALHASGKNTGVVHSPFYLDPQKKKTIAKASLLSAELWRKLAFEKKIPWLECGTIDVSMDENQHRTLQKYLKWGQQNGLSEGQLVLLDSYEVTKKESNLKCYSGLYCSSDVSTDYHSMTKQIQQFSERLQTRFIFGRKVTNIQNKETPKIFLDDNSQIESKFVINCAGSHALEIAKKMDVATKYFVLHFRGEYWVADPKYSNIVNTNVYSVAKFPDFPFLDPHWIKRANGQSEIGPNAVPVPDAESYEVHLDDLPKTLAKLGEILGTNLRNLLFNYEFISLVTKEWKSSLSKTAMVNRVKQFIPSIKPSYFTKRGTAGIRSPIITNKGEFLSEILQLNTSNSVHILNYNSPGATGAPAYSAFLIQNLINAGILNKPKKQKHSMWDFDKIIDKMP